MAKKTPQYPLGEFARLGDAMFSSTISPLLKSKDVGKFAAIDIENGAYEIDANELEACHRLEARFPECQTWLMRVGRQTRRFGGSGEADMHSLRRGLADMEAGRVISLDDLDKRVRNRLGS